MAGKRAIRLGVAVLAAAILVITPLHAETPRRLTVVSSASWVPFAFVDDEGTPRGVLVDIWRLFGERQGVEIDFLMLDWTETIDAISQGRAHVHGGISPSVDSAAHLEFSIEIMRITTLLFAHYGAGIGDVTELGGSVVGVVAGTAEETFLTTHFPTVRVRQFSDSDSMVKAAVAGAVDAFAADYPTGHYRLILEEAVDQFEAVDPLFTTAIDAAVAPGADDLLAFVDAGLATIADAEIRAIERRWLVPGKPMPPWLWPAVAGGAVAFAGIGALLHYQALRRTVRRRTVALSDAVVHLETANRELDRRAHIDALTGVANRQRFHDVAHREIGRASRYNRPLALVLVDLDGFKALNDRFGHLAGDVVLKQVAAIASQEVREVDLVARFGGDEFVLILPETAPVNAAEVASRIVGRLTTEGVIYEGRRLELGASFGIAPYEPPASIDAWLRDADRALYKQKAERQPTLS